MIRHQLDELETCAQRLDALETILNQTMANLAHPVANLHFDEVSTVIHVKANYP